MKTLILNGSPKKSGKIGRMLNLIKESTEIDPNSEVHFFNANDLEFRSCTGCMYCRKNRICCLKQDDAHKIAEELNWCDTIVIETPVYWGNMNGQLKRLFDRLAGNMMDESKYGLPIPLHKGKKSVIVTSCTTPFPFNVLAGQTTKAIASIEEILGYSGFKTVKKIVFAGTKNRTNIPKKIELKCKKALLCI